MTDVIGQAAEYARYADLLTKEEFMRLFQRSHKDHDWFTGKELEKFSSDKNTGSLAARYLIKKRICEVLGTIGFENQVEILNDQYGKPEISLGEQIEKALRKVGYSKIICSISHSRNYVTGLPIFCK
jgi:phosphopantetheinyl transferase (holo-ACP synthase)